jgi:hypothetical protein
MLARFIRAEVAQADQKTQCVGAADRVAVRPLACRGLASYDRHACAQAASGKIDAIPYSESHMRVRSLVQNAMQSALQDARWRRLRRLEAVALTAFLQSRCRDCWQP